MYTYNPKPVLLILAVLLYTTLSGCCGCKDSKTYCVNINGTSLTAMNNSDSVARIAVDETVPGLALALELNVSNDIKMCYSKPNVYFGKATYAFKCDNEHYKHSDSIRHVSIIADRDYDSAHPKGTELNDLFYRSDDVEQHNHEADSRSFLYYAQKAPDQNGTFIFTARLTFDTGHIVESESQPVNLSK